MQTLISSTFKRFRTLRENTVVRALHAEIQLKAVDFIMPYFIVEGNKIKKEINGLTGVFRYSPDTIIKEVESLVKSGIDKIILFGNIENSKKDDIGSFAYSINNPVNIAIRKIKKEFPNICVLSDVCMCSYTHHGHCGILKGQEIDNDATLTYLSKIAMSQAEAGSDMVAPSSMMDGQVKSIREALNANGNGNTKILSYSAKYASSFYKPFREAANSAPSFGDRKTYQMDYRTKNQGIEEIKADIEEGADMVMVKPAHTYLDIISRATTTFPDIKLAAYHVSGEYMLLQNAAQHGIINLDEAMFEVLTAIKRAGASNIISYHSKQIASLL